MSQSELWHYTFIWIVVFGWLILTGMGMCWIVTSKRLEAGLRRSIIAVVDLAVWFHNELQRRHTRRVVRRYMRRINRRNDV